MRTKCANCGMIYDIPVSDMDMRTPIEVTQSGTCPGCGSNAHDPLEECEVSFNRTDSTQKLRKRKK